MHNPEKIERLLKLRRRINRELSADYGDQTEYLDRALDQINYALHELQADEDEFRAGLED